LTLWFLFGFPLCKLLDSRESLIRHNEN